MAVFGTDIRNANILYGLKRILILGRKIKANILRDAKKIEMLKLQGWKVIVVWECELKNSVRKETLEK